jgi:hypothetical protein
MKITKGQLKRIIAEEHALVYGTRKPARKRTRRLTAKQRRIVEAKKKRAILAEVRMHYSCDQVLEEGLGSFLKKLGGFAMQGAKKAKSAYDDTMSAWDEISDQVDLEEKKKEALLKAIKADAVKLNSQLGDALKASPEFKDAVDSFKDDKNKDEKTQQLFAVAYQAVKSLISLPELSEA